MALRKPYLLFLGDAPSDPYAKTAFGIAQWAQDACLAQMRLPDARVDAGLADMTAEEAARAGAGSFVIGVAAFGGALPQAWWPALLQAASCGMDIVSGLHASLSEVPGLADAARASGAALVEVRRPGRAFGVASGRKRSGSRLLTVGTDCAVGKKYTALALSRAMHARGIDAEFRATGQTGIMIAGSGVPIDAIVSDFVSGAAEWLSPDAAPDHWDIIEGQGSLFHPAYAGVTLGLVHGSQPDVLVLCHDPGRQNLSGYPDYPMPSLHAAVSRYIEAAQLTNPRVRLAGVSLNTARLDAQSRERLFIRTQSELGVPCFDPLLSSLDPVIDRIAYEPS